jgi:hypothetical protein
MGQIWLSRWIARINCNPRRRSVEGQAFQPDVSDAGQAFQPDSVVPPGAFKARAAPFALLAALAVFGISHTAHAQPPMIVVGPPSFQTLAGPSLEDAVLYRMRIVGPRVPGDEIQLARLAELRVIATLANIQNDLPGSITGVQLQSEAFALWNATDAFDQAVRYLPPDLQNLAWSQMLLTDVDAAFGRMHASLGSMPSLSPRGAYYLEGIAELLPFAENGLQLIEADIIPPAPLPAKPVVSLADLHEQAGLLAAHLTERIKAIRGRDQQDDPRARESVIAEISRLLELVAGFDRVLVFEPTLPDVLESFRLLLRGAQSAEGILVQTRMAPAWRQIRDRLNAISDALGLPRAVGPLTRDRPGSPSPRATALLAVIDQASTLLGAALDAPVPRGENGNEHFASGSKAGDDGRRLQIKLLEFHQRVLAGDTIGELAEALREIEALSGQLSSRTLSTVAIYRGGRRERPYKLEQMNRTISRLRELLAEEPKG